jgi:hypothetical protein
MKNRRTQGGGLGEWTYPRRGTRRRQFYEVCENGRTRGTWRRQFYEVYASITLVNSND